MLDSWAASLRQVDGALFMLQGQVPGCLCRSLVSPVVAGVELLPSADTVRPLLFVGNHSRMGVYDLPWILSELYMRGIKVQTTSVALQLITSLSW